MIGRYFVPEPAISYAEEVIVYLVIWAIMFVSSQLVRRDGHVRPDVALRKLPPQVLRWVECSTASWPSRSALPRLVRLADRRTSIQIDERSSTGLQFPIGSITRAPGRQRADGGPLYVRLVRFALDFDPATMTCRPQIDRENQGPGCACHKPAAASPEMMTFLFLLMFFGLLAAGMPIFLVLGLCAAILSSSPASR